LIGSNSAIRMFPKPDNSRILSTTVGFLAFILRRLLFPFFLGSSPWRGVPEDFQGLDRVDEFRYHGLYSVCGERLAHGAFPPAEQFHEAAYRVTLDFH